MTKLSTLFTEARSRTIEWEGRIVHSMHEITVPPSATHLEVNFIDRSMAHEQALRIKSYGGTIEINGEQSSDSVLWSDSAPQGITAVIVPDEPETPVIVRLWNAWRDPMGVMQAWIGDAGMLVEEEPDGAVLLRCSDGFDEPSFDDLVVRLRVS